MSNCTHCVPTHDLISHLRYEHNLVRDTAIMAVAHLVWLLLALLLTYALLGLADNAEVLQLPAEVFAPVQFICHSIMDNNMFDVETSLKFIDIFSAALEAVGETNGQI